MYKIISPKRYGHSIMVLTNSKESCDSIMLEQLPKDWADAITPYADPIKLAMLKRRVNKQYDTKHVLPHRPNLFKAFELTPFDKVKVVILGQDPYPTDGHAMGLSFSVPEGAPVARSLKNIFKEREADLGIPVDQGLNGDLSLWAEDGVLLLNTILTVEAGQPASHKNIGWQALIDPVFEALNQSLTPIVFILWGGHAHKYLDNIDVTLHKVVMSSHPSPLGATKTDQPFTGSRCFSKANLLLTGSGQTPIDWQN